MPQYLKSLELQGYKTFANRTRFEFAERVTAVVGPNGSGKSNVVDSLRWVLGEQSYGLLRGKRTDDMIFSGSEQRPRSGMASATVVFDNENHWLPLDFNEVSITRNAYRDGQNEYLINGQKVRLRDVTELLSQAGLAERTYTIVGQGLVDIALSLRAEERRRLFEEAAGIGLHRGRREEALRRLDATKRNLERLQDILAELEPRLKSLVNQMERVQKYEQVQKDLRGVLREWYGYHWHRMQAEFVRAQHYAQQQESLLMGARSDQSAVAQSLTSLRDEIQGMRARLNSWHRQQAQFHNRREEVSRDLAVFAERTRSYQEQSQNSSDELARLVEELDLHQTRLQQAGSEWERARLELEEAENQAGSARKALQTRQAERERQEREVQAARKSLSDAYTRRDRLQARLSERQAQIERQQQAVLDAANTLAAAEKEVHTAQKALGEAQDGHRKAEAAYKEVETAWQAQRQKVGEVEKARQQALDKTAAAKTERARLKAQLDVIQQAEQSLTGYGSGTRLIIEAGRKAQLRGVKGAFIPSLEVPAELETAIAAALGEHLNAVLLESDDVSDRTLDLLAAKTARGALLPLNSLAPAEPLHLAAQEADCLGIAAQLVNAPAELRPAVDVLLGDVLVVKDRAAARRALAGQPRSARAVTLRGDVFYASGPILSAPSQGSGDAGVLSRARQRRELTDALAHAERHLAQQEEQQQALEKELASLRTAADALARQTQDAQRRAAETAAALQRFTLAFEQARRQLEWQTSQRQRLENEIKDLDRETAQMNSDIAKAKEAISTVQEDIRHKQNALSALALDEFQGQVAHWETQFALAKRALTDTENRKRERQAALERARQTRALLEKRLDDLKQSQTRLEEEETGLRQAEAQVSQQIDALQQQIQPAEAELEEREKRQVELQRQDDAARQALSRAEQRNAQASIALARSQEGLDSLRQKIEDDFGLVALEYAAEISGPTPLPIDGLVEALPVVAEIAEDLDETIQNYRRQLRRIGPINLDAKREYNEVKERFEFMTTQMADLQKAEQDIRQVIAELDALMQAQFKKTFDAVATEFSKVFTRLFGGGAVRLLLTDPNDLTNTGVDIEARLPGRRAQGLSLLSGGERSLTATALIFALLKTSPTPFCVLDEVDAMLDEANVGRFRDLLNEVSQNTQILIITHNRNTVQVADVIYGVTMERDSSSRVISLRLDQVDGLKGVAE